MKTQSFTQWENLNKTQKLQLLNKYKSIYKQSIVNRSLIRQFANNEHVGVTEGKMLISIATKLTRP